MALEHSGVPASELGLVLLATSTPDYPLPPTAPVVAEALGARSPGAADLAGACSGFLYALSMASGWVQQNQATALVIAANVLSRRLDPTDPSVRAGKWEKKQFMGREISGKTVGVVGLDGDDQRVGPLERGDLSG